MAKTEKAQKAKKPFWRKSSFYIILGVLIINWFIISSVLYKSIVKSSYDESGKMDIAINTASVGGLTNAVMPARYDSLIKEVTGSAQSPFFFTKMKKLGRLSKLLRQKYTNNVEIVENHNSRASAISVWTMMTYDKECFKKWPKECMVAIEKMGAAAKPYNTRISNLKAKNVEIDKEIEDIFLFVGAK